MCVYLLLISIVQSSLNVCKTSKDAVNCTRATIRQEALLNNGPTRRVKEGEMKRFKIVKLVIVLIKSVPRKDEKKSSYDYTNGKLNRERDEIIRIAQHSY